MVPNASGPWKFVRYVGPLKLTAEIIGDGPNGKVYRASSAHLLPYRGMMGETPAEEVLGDQT